MASLKRDDNFIPVLGAVIDNGSGDATAVVVDSATGRLKVSATISSVINDLSDVIITSAGTADIIYYSGTAWVNLPAGVSGRVLTSKGTASAPSWDASGDFSGPASSTDNAIVRFDGAGGKTGQNSGVTISDANVIAGGAVWQGTSVGIAYGGTGTALVDPNADRMLFWDDSVGEMAFLRAGTALTIVGTSLDVSGTARADAEGIVELATSAETTTGTDATRAVTPDGFAGSDYGKRVVGVMIDDSTTLETTGSARVFFRVPSVMNSWNLVAVAANNFIAGTANATKIMIRNKTDSANMLSTPIFIDELETDSSTSATAAVINGATDDVATGDVIAIDVNAIHGTAATGLFVEMIYQLP